MKSLVQTTALIIAIIISSACIYLTVESQSEEVYVDVSAVYEKFNMTRENSSKVDSIISLRQYILDSALAEIEAVNEEYEKSSNSAIKERLQRMVTEYNSKKVFFESDNEKLKSRYRSETLQQLNAYIKEFGEFEEFDIIFGATNDGSVMYARSELDYTKEAIDFINRRYEDGRNSVR